MASSDGDSGGPFISGSNNPVGILKAGTTGSGAITVYSKLGFKPTGTTLR